MELRYRALRDWPAGVPRTQSPSRSLFKSSWSQTLSLLDRELYYLGADQIVIEGGWRPSDIRLDGMPRANAAQPVDPAVVLSFESKFGPLRYACDTYDRWQDNVRAIALSLEALRSVDRWGISKRGEQYRGWGELPSGIAPDAPMTVEAAARLLSEESVESPISGRRVFSEEEILDDPNKLKAAWRIVAKKHHPDAGGDVEVFKKLDRARRTIEESA